MFAEQIRERKFSILKEYGKSLVNKFMRIRYMNKGMAWQPKRIYINSSISSIYLLADSFV